MHRRAWLGMMGLSLSLVPVAGAQAQGVAADRDEVQIRLVGVVQSSFRERISVATRNNLVFSVRATERSGPLDNIRVRDRVQVVGELVGRDQIDAESVRRVAATDRLTDLTGTVRTIDPQRELLVVQGPNNTIVQVNVTMDTDITAGNQRLRLRDLEVGQQITVRGVEQGNGRMRARTIELVGGRTVRFRDGDELDIVSVDATARTFRALYEGQTRTVRLDPAARITRNGERRDVADLRAGQQVRVNGTEGAGGVITATRVAITEGAREGRVRLIEGRIRSVDAAANEFVVNPRGQDLPNRVTIRVNAETVVRRGTMRVRFADVRSGETVTVVAVRRDNDEWDAQEIQLGP